MIDKEYERGKKEMKINRRNQNREVRPGRLLAEQSQLSALHSQKGFTS